jgi:hypothetical protein
MISSRGKQGPAATGCRYAMRNERTGRPLCAQLAGAFHIIASRHALDLRHPE